ERLRRFVDGRSGTRSGRLAATDAGPQAAIRSLGWAALRHAAGHRGRLRPPQVPGAAGAGGPAVQFAAGDRPGDRAVAPADCFAQRRIDPGAETGRDAGGKVGRAARARLRQRSGADAGSVGSLTKPDARGGAPSGGAEYTAEPTPRR